MPGALFGQLKLPGLILRRIYYLLPFLFLFNLDLSTLVFAGSPFLTDDPQTLAYKHQEIYLFSTID